MRRILTIMATIALCVAQAHQSTTLRRRRLQQPPFQDFMGEPGGVLDENTVFDNTLEYDFFTLDGGGGNNNDVTVDETTQPTFNGPAVEPLLAIEPPTGVPTTLAPTTTSPTTLAPTTAFPTTTAPTTSEPTFLPTMEPTLTATTTEPTLIPTTMAPTPVPTTMAPTPLPTVTATLSPTTTAPVPATASPTSLQQSDFPSDTPQVDVAEALVTSTPTLASTLLNVSSLDTEALVLATTLFPTANIIATAPPTAAIIETLTPTTLAPSTLATEAVTTTAPTLTSPTTASPSSLTTTSTIRSTTNGPWNVTSIIDASGNVMRAISCAENATDVQELEQRIEINYAVFVAEFADLTQKLYEIDFRMMDAIAEEFLDCNGDDRGHGFVVNGLDSLPVDGVDRQCDNMNRGDGSFCYVVAGGFSMDLYYPQRQRRLNDQLQDPRIVTELGTYMSNLFAGDILTGGDAEIFGFEFFGFTNMAGGQPTFDGAAEKDPVDVAAAVSNSNSNVSDPRSVGGPVTLVIAAIALIAVVAGVVYKRRNDKRRRDEEEYDDDVYDERIVAVTPRTLGEHSQSSLLSKDSVPSDEADEDLGFEVNVLSDHDSTLRTQVIIDDEHYNSSSYNSSYDNSYDNRYRESSWKEPIFISTDVGTPSDEMQDEYRNTVDL